MKKLTIILFGFLFLNIWQNHKILACDCEINENVSQARKHSEVVFTGRVIKKEQISIPNTNYSGDLVYFKVDRIWKGSITDNLVIFTSPLGTSCGYPFQLDESYLVYAYKNLYGYAEADICSRTKKIENAQEDLKKLGKGKYRLKVLNK